jgi:RNA polymerase subunit RPABC4/transcription elongation factor Spt4
MKKSPEIKKKMAKRKVCKKCKTFVEGGQCAICKGNQLTDNWKGRLYISDPQNSMIAKEVKIDSVGEFAIKIH